MVAPELVQPTVTVARELQPYPHEGSIALAPLVLLLLVVSVIYAIRRRRMRRDRAGVLATVALGAALGNALCELDSMLRADRPAVMVMAKAPEPAAVPGDQRLPEPSAIDRAPAAHG